VQLTETQQEILYNAWALSLDGKGMVLEDWAYVDVHPLAEQGWLERRFEPDGEMSWWWTAAAETALDLNALRRNAPADMN